MLERYCDVLIIGTELPGLITGAFLARRGLTVQVLDLDPYARNEKEPDPFCVAHLHSKLLRSILGRLNVPENDIQGLTAHDSPLQVIFPRKRIDVSPNPVSFYEELEREFPEQHAEIKHFYENLTQIKHQAHVQELYSLMLPTGFSERRALSKFVKLHGLDKRLDELNLPDLPDKTLQTFINSQLKLVTYAHLDHPFAFQVAELLNPIEGEILSIQGGHHYLKKLFLDRILHHEGGVKHEAKIDKLLFRHGIFSGATLTSGEGDVLSRYVIWNAQLRTLLDYLPKMFRFRGLRKRIEAIKPQGYWFTAHYEVPRRFIPSPMKENMIVIANPQETLTGSNYLYVQIKNSDPPTETTRLSASYLLPADVIDGPDSSFASLHHEVLETLRELIPFADENLVQVFPLTSVVRDEGTLFPLRENDFEIFRQTARDHPIYHSQADSFSDLFPITHKTAAPNFYITSPEILGCLGYEGKYMLGLKVTDIIWGDVEKEKKRAMKRERRIA